MAGFKSHQIAVQHAFAVGVRQSDRHLAKQDDRLVRRQRAALAQQIVQRAVLHVLHHVVRRFGMPADIQQLDHIAIGRQEHQLFDLARQQRPIQAAAVQVELDRHAPA
ncbi:MAG: hypothetical protein MUE50_22630, partial [Pirellulaceae bacterium]|nr:hypothetical protein [Pirellulaceae bacterium]